jgi:hypothetical protein
VVVCLYRALYIALLVCSSCSAAGFVLKVFGGRKGGGLLDTTLLYDLLFFVLGRDWIGLDWIGSFMMDGMDCMGGGFDLIVLSWGGGEIVCICGLG